MPMILRGYGAFEGITRKVKCIGDTKPDFVIGPNNILFKKKIITSSSISNPVVVQLKLTNMSYKIINWEIDIEEKDDDGD